MKKHEQKIIFYDCIRWVLIVNAYIGLLPLKGLHNGNVSALKYSWRTPFTLIIIPFLILQIFLVAIKFYDFVYVLKFIKIARTALSLEVVFMIISFIIFSKNLKGNLIIIKNIEDSLPFVDKPGDLKKKINAFLIATSILGLGEFILFKLCVFSMLSSCYSEEINNQLFHVSLLTYAYKWFFDYFPLNNTLAIIVHISSLQLKFVCTVSDITIVVCSLYLIKHVKKFNDIVVNKTQNNQNNQPSWTELRVHFTTLSRLIRTVDNMISPITFLSFFNNSLTLCLTIYYLINSPYKIVYSLSLDCAYELLINWPVIVYSYYALLFILARVVFISYFGDQLYTLSRQCLGIVQTIPMANYTIELQQLLDQIYNTQLALTGFSLFQVHRGMILTIIGTLVTYELMLFQFHAPDIE